MLILFANYFRRVLSGIIDWFADLQGGWFDFYLPILAINVFISLSGKSLCQFNLCGTQLLSCHVFYSKGCSKCLGKCYPNWAAHFGYKNVKSSQWSNQSFLTSHSQGPHAPAYGTQEMICQVNGHGFQSLRLEFSPQNPHSRRTEQISQSCPLIAS